MLARDYFGLVHFSIPVNLDLGLVSWILQVLIKELLPGFAHSWIPLILKKIQTLKVEIRFQQLQ